MSATDAGFLYLERPHALLHIAAVGVLGGRLTTGDLIARLESRLHHLSRYAQRALPVPFGLGHPSWEDDPDFDVRNHVRRWALPGPGGEAELVETCAGLLSQPLERGRPLWEMHLLEGLEGGRTALFQKVHHCMIDGVSGAQILERILDDPEGEGPPRSLLPVAPPTPGAGVRLGRSLRDGLFRQLSLVRAAGAVLARPTAARRSAQRLLDAAYSGLRLATRDVPRLPWNAPLGPRRRLAFTRLPMEGVRRVRRAHGCTVNDVVLCVLAGGLNRYLRGMAVETDGLEVTALVPVSLRGSDEMNTLGNRISAMLVPLAVDSPDDLAGLAATCVISERLKTRAACTGIDACQPPSRACPLPRSHC